MLHHISYYFKLFRYKLKDIIVPRNGNFIGAIYDITIALIAVLSIIPLISDYETTTNSFVIFVHDYNWIWLMIFVIDYILRWFIADLVLEKGKKSFILFPFTLWGFIDLLAITGGILGTVLEHYVLQVLQAFIIFRVFRLIVLFPKLHEGVKFVFRSLFREWKILLIILITLLAVTFIGAVFIYVFEKDEPGTSILDFGDALWFVFITITTIGYGDVYVQTTVGRILTSIFALLGISLIALITATVVSGFTKEINEFRDYQKQQVEEISKELNKRSVNFKHNLIKLKEKYSLEELKKYQQGLNLILKQREFQHKREQELEKTSKIINRKITKFKKNKKLERQLVKSEKELNDFFDDNISSEIEQINESFDKDININNENKK